MTYNHCESQPIGVMVSSGQALSEKSQELQDFLKRLNYTPDFIKFVYQNEKESVRRRLQQCRFLVVLADASWCKSEKCQLELSFAEETSKELGGLTIIPVLFESVEFFESYRDIKQAFSTKEVIDSRDSPNSSELFGRIEALLKKHSEDVDCVLDSPITISTPYSSLSSPSFSDPVQGSDYEFETLHPIGGGYLEPLVATFRPLAGEQSCSVAFWSPAFDLLACNERFQGICAFSERASLEALIFGVDKRSILEQLEFEPVVSLPNTVLTLDPEERRVHSCISFRKFGGLDGIFSYQLVVQVEAKLARNSMRRSGNSHLKAKSFPGLPSPKVSCVAPPATLTVSCSAQESRYSGRLENHRPLSSASFQPRAKLESQQVPSPNSSGYNVFKLDSDTCQQRKRLLSQVSPQKSKTRKYNDDRWLSVSEEENDRSIKRLASSPKGSAVVGDKGFCVIPMSHPNAPEEALKVAQQNSQRPLFMITPDDFQSKVQDGFEVQSGFRHPQKKRKECWENLTEDNHYHIYRGPTGQ